MVWAGSGGPVAWSGFGFLHPDARVRPRVECLERRAEKGEAKRSEDGVGRGGEMSRGKRVGGCAMPSTSWDLGPDTGPGPGVVRRFLLPSPGSFHPDARVGPRGESLERRAAEG